MSSNREQALYIRPYASYLGSRSSGLHRNRNGSVVPLHDSSEFRYLAAVMQSSDARLAEADRRVKVGVGVFLLNDQNEFLMGRRKGSNGAGTFALPGGHLEFQETFEECAARELEEETGISVAPGNVYFMTCTNNILHEDSGKHYVTIFMVVRLPANQHPRNLEPEKCEAWEWFSWNVLLDWATHESGDSTEGRCLRNGQQRLFPPMVTLIKSRPGILPNQFLPL